MSLFGVQLNSHTNRLFTQLKLHQAKSKTHPNLRTLFHSFCQLEPNMTGLISVYKFQKVFLYQEGIIFLYRYLVFRQALNQNGLFFKQYQIKIFHQAFKSENNLVCWMQFLSCLKEKMGPLRRQAVENIYNFLASDSKVTKQKLQTSFNPQALQAYRHGKLSIPQIQYFLSFLTVSCKQPEDEVDQETFVGFYDDVNLNYPDTGFFIESVSAFWGYKPEKVKPATQEELRAIVKALKFKLIQKSQGASDETLMLKAFLQFDQNRNQCIGAHELDLMLKKLQLPIEPRLVQPLLQKLDQNKSGYIQYGEFKKMVFSDQFE